MFLENALSFILVIAVLVFIHELGHFLAAIWTGMRADVFALGMGPRVFGWNKINGFTFGKLSEDVQSQLGENTDYRVCALPIGGYVKILGMVDESMDNKLASSQPQLYEFRSKGPIAKAFVLSAGVIMNLMLALAFFWTVLFGYGREDMRTTTIGYVESKSLADSLGFKQGDRIVSIDGAVVTEWGSMFEKLVGIEETSDRLVEIKRNETRVNILVPSTRMLKTIADQREVGIYPNGYTVKIGAVMGDSPASRASILAGDQVLEVNGKQMLAVSQLQSQIKNQAGQKMQMTVKRGGKIVSLTVDVPQKGPIGVQLAPEFSGERTKVTYGALTSLSMAWDRTIGTISVFISSIKHVIDGTLSAKQTFGGPIRIAEMSGQQSRLGIDALLTFMAGLSVSLAVINLLPVPGLDGGHLVFVVVEAILRREISVTVKMRVQQIGMALLLALMAYVFYIDLTR